VTARTAAERQAARRARLAAAKALTAEQAAVQRAEAVQAGLPLVPVADQEALPSSAPGRPAGSVAKKTAEWQACMLGRYRSPLVVLGEIFSRSVTELAEELGCTRLEAFDRQLKAAVELAPFIHSKMPAAVQLDGAPVAPVTVQVSQALAVRLGMAGSEADQAVSGGDPA
jgi:AraC-like DNA-binding protein